MRKFRMIFGAEPPGAGQLVLGDTVKLACVEQSRESLDNDALCWEAMLDPSIGNLILCLTQDDRRLGGTSHRRCPNAAAHPSLRGGGFSRRKPA
jgi:hypothetical protein